MSTNLAEKGASGQNRGGSTRETCAGYESFAEAIIFRTAGSADVLTVANLPDPVPACGDSVIDVAAAGGWPWPRPRAKAVMSTAAQDL
jgi:hypothetical protein